jgi:tetratricopeptide (TPR) repeat protein
MAESTTRRSVNILWGALAVAALLLVALRIANRPTTSVRGPLKILTPPFTANKAELIQKLRDRKFQDLDAQLNSYQKAFEKDPLEEGNLSIAFEAFNFTDPSLSPILDEWVKSEPSSYPAHVARAKYLIALGWQARGDQNSDKTSDQQLSEMQAHFVEGVKEAIAAIKLNPQASIAYASIIDAAKGVSDYKTIKGAYGASLKTVPLSLSTRAVTILALRPRWGGSYDAMDKFADAAQKFAAQNPRLESLKGFADVDRGDIASSAGNQKQAVDYCNRALEEGGDFALAYLQRGTAYDALHRYDEALEDLSRANRLRPQEPHTLEILAYVYAHLNRPKDTLATIQEYQQFAVLPADLVSLQQWAQNFGGGTQQAVKTGGD